MLCAWAALLVAAAGFRVGGGGSGQPQNSSACRVSSLGNRASSRTRAASTTRQAMSASEILTRSRNSAMNTYAKRTINDMRAPAVVVGAVRTVSRMLMGAEKRRAARSTSPQPVLAPASTSAAVVGSMRFLSSRCHASTDTGFVRA